MIIWTRAAEDWDSDRHLFKKHEKVLRMPCLKYSEIKEDINPKQTPDISVMTSKRSLTYLLKQPKSLELLKNCKKHYAVGKETAKLMKEHGFHATYPVGVKGAKDLVENILNHEDPKTCLFLPGAKDRFFDIESYLEEKREFNFVRVNVYETHHGVFDVQGQKLSLENLKQLHLNFQPGLICFASPSSVEGFVKGFSCLSTMNFDSLKILAIGPSTKEKCDRYFKNAQVVKENSLKALISEASKLI